MLMVGLKILIKQTRLSPYLSLVSDILLWVKLHVLISIESPG